VVSLFYSLVLFVYALWITLYGRDNEGVIIFLMVTLSIAGTAVETFFQLRGVLVGVVAMDIIFYYLYIHIEHYKVDVLTGTLNRDSFLADIKDLSPSDAVDVISVDMNGLKRINDTRGHRAGDEAIKAVVIELRRALDSYLGKCRIYRVGGDEFVIICRRLSQSDLDRVFDRFGQIIKESGYSFAAGSAHWGEGESFDAVYGRADKEMYKAKEKYHHLRK
jgi:diguanylate cyclase (GGDEF)-like protein